MKNEIRKIVQNLTKGCECYSGADQATNRIMVLIDKEIEEEIKVACAHQEMEDFTMFRKHMPNEKGEQYAATKNETRKHILQVGKFLSKIVACLIDRGIFHDKSKLEAPEDEIFDKYTPQLAQSTYGSKEYKQFLKEMKPALKHHYKVNRHHPEHFHNAGIFGMSLIDVMEMLCDWKAATMRHNDGDIRKSIETNQKRFKYSDELKHIFHNTVDDLKW